MDERKPVPQLKFSSVEDFIEHNNNYYSIWIEDACSGENRRNAYPAYKRMHERYPEFSRNLFEKASRMWRENYRLSWNERLPWEELFISYELMANLVFEEGCRLTS
jgi:hypothetical protein